MTLLVLPLHFNLIRAMESSFESKIPHTSSSADRTERINPKKSASDFSISLLSSLSFISGNLLFLKDVSLFDAMNRKILVLAGACFVLGMPGYAADTDALAIGANIQARHLPFGTILDPIFAFSGSDQIVGATMVASHAGEIISELTTAIKAGVGLGALGDVIHPYPTQADAIRRVAGLYTRTRLTPFVAGLMKRWFAFTR